MIIRNGVSKKLNESPLFKSSMPLDEIINDPECGVSYRLGPFDPDHPNYFYECKVEGKATPSESSFKIQADGDVPFLVYRANMQSNSLTYYPDVFLTIAKEFVRSVNAACDLKNRSHPAYGYLSVGSYYDTPE